MSDAGKAAGAASDKTAGAGAGAGAGAAGAADKGAGGAGAGAGGAAAGADKATAGADAGKGTIIDTAGAGAGAGADKGAGTAPATWPEDWRDQIAGGDAKMGALLKRYSDPGAVAKALGALRTRLDSGEFKKGLAADATPEEITAFRKENGIPDKPEQYEMPKDIEILDMDRPIIDGYLADAHKRNLTPAEAQANIKFFYEAREAMAAQVDERDKQRKAENEDILHQTWGAEFRSNINGVVQFVESQTSKEFCAALMSARMGNGNIVGNDATALNFLVGLMKEINPHGTLVPSGEASAKALTDRIGELEAMQRDEKGRKEYYRDDKYSNELKGLYEQRERMNSRQGRAA